MAQETVAVTIATYEAQTRRHAGGPFVLPPVAMAHIVQEHEREPLFLAATLPHDLVEDIKRMAQAPTARVPRIDRVHGAVSDQLLEPR